MALLQNLKNENETENFKRLQLEKDNLALKEMLELSKNNSADKEKFTKVQDDFNDITMKLKKNNDELTIQVNNNQKLKDEIEKLRK